MSPSDLVAWLGAVQAQDYPIAKWSLAQRLARRHHAIDRALADGSIIRTHVLRPTWHFVAREDLRWMQALTSPRVLAVMSHYDRRNGVDATLIARSTRIIIAAIERHGHLTRAALADALLRAGISTHSWLVGELLMHAELRALICSGVPDGGRQTYALVDERVPKRSLPTREEALATLTRRYFQSHGPATARDYQWWSGLDATDVARGIDLLGRAVERARVGTRTYMTVGARPRARRTMELAQVIQPFDELVVAYSESRDVVDVRRAARAGARGTGLLTRGIVYDGQIVARWRVARLGPVPRIEVQPLRRLTSGERVAVANAVARFERFSFGPGQVGSRPSTGEGV